MSMRFPDDRRRSCDAKKPYETYEKARKSARWLTIAQQEHVEVYKCRYGDHYHVGHAIPPGGLAPPPKAVAK